MIVPKKLYKYRGEVIRLGFQIATSLEQIDMKIDHKKRYESANEFFSLGGGTLMKMSSDAAIKVCEQAASHGLVIARVEGGCWQFPGFEAQLDCIWDCHEQDMDCGKVKQSNIAASEFVKSESGEHDVFILTTWSM